MNYFPGDIENIAHSEKLGLTEVSIFFFFFVFFQNIDIFCSGARADNNMSEGIAK